MKALLAQVVLVAAALGTSGCLPPKSAASRAKSLDNFANGTAALNHCGADFDTEALAPAVLHGRLPQIVAATAEQRLAVLGALSAVPPGMQAPFFTLGGTISVTAAAAQRCAEVPMTPGEHAFAGAGQGAATSCWRQHMAGEAPVIYVSTDLGAIRHGLLRSFAYLYNQLIVERLETAAQPASDPALANAVAAFVKAREAVGAALLADGALLGNGVPQRLTAFRRLDPRHFNAFALAEAVDSYYCSPGTLATFQRSFPATYRAFNGAAGLTPQFGAPWFQ